MDDRNFAALPPLPPLPRTWDGRLARRIVMPLRATAVTPNQLTTLRLAIGVAGACALAVGGWTWANVGALLVALSNFVDHADGELARITGKGSAFGHRYDLACDWIVTVLLFTCMGIGAGPRSILDGSLPAVGLVAGVAVALIFFLRMRIEAQAGKAGVAQGFAAGFETEDVLYLLPLVTLAGIESAFLVAAACGASLFAIRTAFELARATRAARGGASCPQ